MLSVLLVILCVAAIVTQAAILRDNDLPELDLVESLRYLRIAAYGIAAASTVYVIASGHWLQPQLAISLILVALADVVGAAARLFAVLDRTGASARVVAAVSPAKPSPRP